jgi:hypothetical protein
MRTIVDWVFGIHVNENVKCPHCGKVTHEMSTHPELFHIMNVALLIMSGEQPALLILSRLASYSP